MLRQRLSEKYSNIPYDTPKTRYNLQEEEPILSEKKLALFGLIFSLLVITAKVIAHFGKYNYCFTDIEASKKKYNIFTSYIK